MDANAAFHKCKKRFNEALTLDAIDLFPLRATGGVSPEMALGNMPTRPALLVRLRTEDGCFGWGEIWANFPPRANQHKAHIVEDVIASRLLGTTFVDPDEVTSRLRASFSTYFLHVGQPLVFEHILAGLDIALWDLALRQRGESFVEFIGLSTRAAPTYASSINASDAERLIIKHSGLGQQHFKIKVGFGSKTDLELVRKAAEFCPSDNHIMIDSNQSWGLKEARHALDQLADLAPFFAEEPLRADANLADWQALAKSTLIPLAGGENIYGQTRFAAFAQSGLRFLQPDVAKWGGVSGALDLAHTLPEHANLWPHFMGTAVGQVASLCIAAAAGPDAVCEMDVNENRLRTDLCGDILQIENGKVLLPTEPGLVVPPLDEQLEAFHDSP
ncbi:MAG: mandelate racemase/muconate lactonizing enzyme family protein [Pseudomonadota bacterium]